MPKPRTVTISWSSHGNQIGWWATFPSGVRKRWNYEISDSFIEWAVSFLRNPGDKVEIVYPRTTLVYSLDKKED